MTEKKQFYETPQVINCEEICKGCICLQASAEEAFINDSETYFE